MKQLLDTTHTATTSHHHLLTALDDRAYLLLPPSSGPSNDNPMTSIELLSPPSRFKQAPQQHQQQQQVEKTSESKDKNDSNEHHNPIQAVVCTIDPTQNEIIICAVSRLDKTLSIYSIDTSDNSKQQEAAVKPILIYDTEKRACSLAFLKLPDSKDGIAIVAADLAGDAIAYPVNLEEDRGDRKSKRMLLGHTASMLTGIQIVSDSSTTRILTCDRDEKVRVSAFPQTFIVRGYLLGHEEFISSMDVARDDGCTRCVTCGGDGTVRLWDYKDMEQLSVFRCHDEKVEPIVEDSAAPPTDEQEQSTPTLTDVAISPRGDIVAVIRDDHLVLDILQVTQDETQTQLMKCEELKCPSQPLAVTFLNNNILLVLTAEPSFLLHYNIIKTSPSSSSNNTISITKDMSSPYSHILQSVGESAGITMPKTTLEFDPQTGQLKVMKLKETHENEWTNDAKRKDKHKQKNSRRRKRKAEEKHMKNEMEEDDVVVVSGEEE